MTSGITQLGVQGQLLTHGGGTYLVQGGAMDADGTPLAHTTRASPATVSTYPFITAPLDAAADATLFSTC